MIRRINTEPLPEPSHLPTDATSDVSHDIDVVYDELNRKAADRAIRGEISAFELDQIADMHDQRRAIEKHELKRRRRLAKRALRRGSALPPTHERL